MSRRSKLLHCGQQGLPLVGVFLPDHTVQQRFQHFADARPRRDTCCHQVAAIHSQLADAATYAVSIQLFGQLGKLSKLRCAFRLQGCAQCRQTLHGTQIIFAQQSAGVNGKAGCDGSFSEDRPLGWDPVAEGNRAGDGMACNGNDCRLRRKQGVAVGAAASEMRVPSKARSRYWVPQPELVSEEKATVTPDFTIYARRLLGKYNLCTVQRIAALGTALQPEHAADFAALSELAEQLDADGVCCRVSQLAVNGRDLMAAGVPAGPGIRKVLEALLDGVIREEYPNERQALLAAVQQLAAS